MSFIYLACPYSHPDPETREQRFKAVNRAAAELMRTGHVVFSPISHSHPIAVNHDLPKGWDFWGRIDQVFIALCEKVYVLTLPGWEESHGVNEEIRLAKMHGKEVFLYVPEEL